MSSSFLKEIEDPRVPEAMARIAKKDADIAALRQQIAKIEDEKADIQTELAKIQGQNIDKGDQQQTDKSSQEELAQKVAAAVTAATSESLIERIDEGFLDTEDRIHKIMDDLSDELVYYLNNDPENPKVKEIRKELRLLQDELAQLELDQQEHESEYEEDYWVDPAGGRHYDYSGDDDDDFYDPASMYESGDEELEEKSEGPCWKGYEMIGMKKKGGKKVPNCVPENLDEGYASKFRPGKMIWKGRQFNIDKVENVNDKMDIVYVNGKMMSSKHLESDGAEMVVKSRKEREKRMTKREYERTLKDVMSSAGTDLGELDHSIIYDLAENLYYDPMLRDYVVRRWKKENGYTEWYDTREPSKSEIIEIITNDLEISESYNPASKKNFYKLSEAYVERIDDIDDDYIEEDYVFYVRINEDGNEFIGKIFKISPDGDWFGLVKEGESDTFQKISYDPEYNEDDIIEFLGENYDKVEIIGRNEYNDFIEDDEVEESWPMNTVGSSGPITRY